MKRVCVAVLLLWGYLVGGQHGNVLYQAVIVPPVADMSNTFPAPCKAPVSPDAPKSCCRAHQGLYNELVTCIQEEQDQVKVCCKQLIYGIDKDTESPLNTFWMHKKDLMPYLVCVGTVLKGAIPHFEYAAEPTLVLTYPWKQFSLGTRFKRISVFDTIDAYGVLVPRFDKAVVAVELVPREFAICEIKRDAKEARALFVQLINQLVDRVSCKEGLRVIPYVWGGSSFITGHEPADFYIKDGAWHRQKRDDALYTGYDCSEFIMRMARIAGINFPYKTAFMMQSSLKLLDSYDELQEGDIIWTPGHVMIVSNKERGEIIESRGYSSGHGCVHRLRLEQLFEGISSYDDLLSCYRAQLPVWYLNSEGAPIGAPVVCKLLKLIHEADF